MGFMRKALFLGTGGLSGAAGVKANSKKERTAKAAEKQLRLQKQMLKEQQRAQRTQSVPHTSAPHAPTAAADGRPRFKVKCPSCSTALVSPAGSDITCPRCHIRMVVTPQGESAVASITRPHELAPSGSLTDELERLSGLHRSGSLSDDEFAAAKARVLSQS
jgi:DNA-directed RNA polymerase subunit RPC12/RpoP